MNRPPKKNGALWSRRQPRHQRISAFVAQSWFGLGFSSAADVNLLRMLSVFLRSLFVLSRSLSQPTVATKKAAHQPETNIRSKASLWLPLVCSMIDAANISKEPAICGIKFCCVFMNFFSIAVSSYHRGHLWSCLDSLLITRLT